MRPARIIATVVFTAAIALTGCRVHSKAAQPSPPQTAPKPTPVDPTQVDRQALIYAAVLRQYLTSGDAAIAADYRFPHIFVIDHAVPGTGILITLGPVDGTGDRVQLGVNGQMGCLGANSLTYEVQQTSSGWMVSGITAFGPVA